MKKAKNILISFLTNMMIVCFDVLFSQILIGVLIFGQKSVVLTNYYIQIPILILVSILFLLYASALSSASFCIAASIVFCI
jgi:hypothetical protein